MQGQFTGEGWRDRVALIAAASLLGSALAFGGGSRGAGDLVVHLVALPALVLATVCQRFTFAPDPAFRLELNPGITLRPRAGVSVVVRADPGFTR